MDYLSGHYLICNVSLSIINYYLFPRQYGGIPALISQLRSHDSIQVQMAVLGALRNLSYGRANVENKMQIASDAGLPELSLVLKSTRQSEVKVVNNQQVV